MRSRSGSERRDAAPWAPLLDADRGAGVWLRTGEVMKSYIGASKCIFAASWTEKQNPADRVGRRRAEGRVRSHGAGPLQDARVMGAPGSLVGRVSPRLARLVLVSSAENTTQTVVLI